jgi:hypothetical protein
MRHLTSTPPILLHVMQLQPREAKSEVPVWGSTGILILLSVALAQVIESHRVHIRVWEIPDPISFLRLIYLLKFFAVFVSPVASALIAL